jgi:F-type H+-transporting ATPase subunit b
MLTVTVTHAADGLQVVFEPSSAFFVAQGEEEAEELDEGPSPIAPETKELLWGLGAFVVFLVLMRFVLFPRVKEGMTARYGKIQKDHEDAEAMRIAAQQEVADYEVELDEVRAEAITRIDAARHQLEEERAARLADVNQGIAARRSSAAADAEAARAAARGDVEAAAADVAALTIELSIGRRPDDQAVRDAVRRAMSVGVGV